VATTRPPAEHQTGFKVGAVDVRFGILIGDGAAAVPDWARESRVVEIAGPGNFTETQFLGFGPSKVTYAVWFASVDDYRALDALVQQSGTLTLVHDRHTAPFAVPPDASYYIAPSGIAYDDLAGVTLLALVSSGIGFDGSVDASATFGRVG